MKSGSTDPAQTMQRLRVGLTGLISVLLLIALATTILNFASDEAPVTAVGAPKAEVVANITANQEAEAAEGDEALAEIGVAPGAATAENAVDGVGAGGR